MNHNCKQGDLVFLKNPITMPDGKDLPHPILVISSNIPNNYEKYFTGVMMSATRNTDRFSFKCSNEMFEAPLEKNDCQIRLYIIVGFCESQVSTFKNRMKEIHLKALLREINERIFCVP